MIQSKAANVSMYVIHSRLKSEKKIQYHKRFSNQIYFVQHIFLILIHLHLFIHLNELWFQKKLRLNFFSLFYNRKLVKKMIHDCKKSHWIYLIAFFLKKRKSDETLLKTALAIRSKKTKILWRSIFKN